MFAPLGTYTNAMRRGADEDAPTARAASAMPGTIASSMGRAMAVPSPRRKVRLGNCQCFIVLRRFAADEWTNAGAGFFKDK